MEVHAAGTKVGAGEAHKGEAGTVCAAADRYALGLKSDRAHCRFCRLDDVHMRQDHFLHVVVAVLQIENDSAVSVFLVEICHKLGHKCFAA